MRNRAALFLFCLILCCSLFSAAFAANLREDYPLEKILIYSRHNLRAPLNIDKNSMLFKITPYTWKASEEKSGELTSKGGELETIMGQYFRKWLEAEKLIPENYIPKQGETRFYANSAQRTIATARYFSAGFLPIANIEVERKLALNKMDPVFNFHYRSTLMNSAVKGKIKKELDALNVKLLGENAAKDVTLLEKILDFKDSIYAKENKINSFLAKDKNYFTVTVDAAIHFGGSVRPAMSAADALILQYQESSGNNDAAFGTKLSVKEWERLGHLKSLGIYTVFRLPTISKMATQPMRKLMKDELTDDTRKFTFLCGHDLHIAATLSALGVKDCKLLNTTESIVPIGAKVVIEKRRGKNGKTYADLKLIYQSTEQIRNREPLTLNNPPMIAPLELEGLTRNKDGLYSFDDVVKKITEDNL